MSHLCRPNFVNVKKYRINFILEISLVTIIKEIFMLDNMKNLVLY